MPLTAKDLLAAVKADILVEMPSLGGAADNETPFFVNSYAYGGAAMDFHLYKLKAAGIPARRIHSPYVNLSGVAVPDKYAKKAEKLLFNESALKSIRNEGFLDRFKDGMIIAKAAGKDGIEQAIELKRRGAGPEAIAIALKLNYDDHKDLIDRFHKGRGGSVTEDSQGLEHDAVDEATLSVKKCDVCDTPIGAGQSVCADCNKKAAKPNAFQNIAKICREDKDPESYFGGSDEKGWVLYHQGQPLNANPQGGQPVDRDRVRRVAKQYGLPTTLPVWDGKKFSGSLKEWGETQMRDVRHQCKKCGNLWVGPAYEDECPKCHARQFEECSTGKK